VRRAAEKGVDLFALTDHDELGGLAIAIEAAAQARMRFVPGVEISVTYAEQNRASSASASTRTVTCFATASPTCDPAACAALRDGGRVGLGRHRRRA